jgi:hypothetical protein
VAVDTLSLQPWTFNIGSGPRSIWALRRVGEVGARFPDRLGEFLVSQAVRKLEYASLWPAKTEALFGEDDHRCVMLPSA